jgi:hypothetical protein
LLHRVEVHIVAPPANHPVHPAIAYMDRRGNYSINVQIICTSDLQITALDPRFPGSVHDSAICMSNVQRTLTNMWRANLQNTWLLGDSGYPLQPFILTPIVGAQEGTPEERYTLCQILA